MKFSVFQVSRKGGREKNEDRMGYCYTRESGLFVLADGMGGHPEGEVAAQLALQTISALYQREARPTVEDVKSLPGRIGHGRAPADHAVRQPQGHARHAAHHRRRGRAAGHHATWVHCGDSRLYVVRDGRLLTRTRDHSHPSSPKPNAARTRRSTATCCSPASARRPSRCST
jgi:serine/threonine protein phosphatase PrpC